jgi:hypothetical protein
VEVDLDLGELVAVLERHGVRYVVIGAIAAAAGGAPVVTRDLDVTPARDPHNLGQLAAALQELDARLRTPSDPDGVAFPLERQMLAGSDFWTLTTRAGDLDLVFAPAGAGGFDDLVRDASVVEIAGTSVLVASLVDVIRLKEASGRDKDVAQLPLLRRTLERVRRG